MKGREDLDALDRELRDALEVIATLTDLLNGRQQVAATPAPRPQQVEILVVEDSPTQAAALGILLEEHGYRVTHAANGAEALAAVRGHRPTLVISDVAMPVMDGFAFCQALREDPAVADVPVILLTALDDAREIIRGLKARADYYLTKPYDDAHLLSKIELVLSLPRGRFESEDDESIIVDLAGDRETIKTNRRRLINLLFSTYENTVRQNHELARMRDEQAQFTKRLEEEVRDRTAALSDEVEEHKRTEVLLQHAKETAEAASRAKSQFLANMSHEIRTPMAGILGMTQLLLRSDLTTQQRKHLEMVRSSGDALMIVINEVLDFSKVETGKVSLDIASFNLRGPVEDAIALLSLPARQKNLRLRWHVAAAIPETLMGDAGHLRRIIINLVGNAIRFTDSGEVAVEVNLAESGLQMSNGHAKGSDPFEPGSFIDLHCCVRDTGIGIPEDKQDLIFRAFEQVDNSHARRFGGTGLGLAISSQLVAMMGGRLWVESVVGSGSAFHFTARYGLAARNDAAAVAPVAAPRPALGPLRILVAEDNPVNQELMRCLLEANGHAVTIAGNGREAIEAVHRSVFDVVLMDVQMPEMDGHEATALIRAGETWDHRQLPIIAMTASAMPSDRMLCLSAGMNEYVAKPVQPKLLFEVIARCVESVAAAEIRGEPAAGAAPAGAVPI